MRRRGLRIAMLLFVTLWFGVLVPVHTRGQMPLPGDCSSQVVGRECCTPGHRHESKSNLPAWPRVCGVCYIIATLDLPPDLILYVPNPSASEPAEVADPVVCIVAKAPSTCLERAPPFAC
jgi:hypothetical protein